MSDWILTLFSAVLAVLYGFLGGLYITGVNSTLGVGWLIVGLLTSVQTVLLARRIKDE